MDRRVPLDKRKRTETSCDRCKGKIEIIEIAENIAIKPNNL
jgi:hypothetical protein